MFEQLFPEATKAETCGVAVSRAAEDSATASGQSSSALSCVVVMYHDLINENLPRFDQ